MVQNTTTTKKFHVAICGGGIGGLSLAVGLLHNGISVTVYESAHKFEEIGAGVSFGPNSIRAMHLLDPAIKAGYETIATQNAFPEKRLTWFDFRLGMKEETWEKEFGKFVGKDGQYITSVEAEEFGQICVHRAHFLDVLIKMVPKENAEFGKRVSDVQRLGNGKMELKFADGTTAEADAVVGCDGVKSRTRQLLLGGDHEMTSPRFTGKYAYRGLIPMKKAVEVLGEELASNSQMYLGHHGHVLTMPIEKGKTMNVVAFRSQEGEWESEKWVLPMNKEHMMKDFEGWGESVMNILPLMEKPDLWALFDHPPAPTYYKGRFAILGDAAHASTPHQGAGAGQAIEDSYILSALLSRVDKVEDIENAFKAYDAIRRPRSQKVVKTSIDTAAIYEFENEEFGTDLELIKKTLQTRYNWIWQEDLELQLQKAVDVMES